MPFFSDSWIEPSPLIVHAALFHQRPVRLWHLWSATANSRMMYSLLFPQACQVASDPAVTYSPSRPARGAFGSVTGLWLSPRKPALGLGVRAEVTALNATASSARLARVMTATVVARLPVAAKTNPAATAWPAATAPATVVTMAAAAAKIGGMV